MSAHTDGTLTWRGFMTMPEEDRKLLLDWLGAIENPSDVRAVKVRRGAVQLHVLHVGRRQASASWRRYDDAPLPPLDLWRSALVAMGLAS